MTILNIHDLRYAYPDGRRALDSLSFQVEAGESIGLLGPNGAGKTTLFLCMAGVLPIGKGQIQIANLDPAVASERKKLPQVLGLVFQNSDDQLFAPSILEDVAFGPLNLGLSHDEVRSRVQEALQQVELVGYEERVPFHLSGGEKRRAALAGVLAMRPAILLLDEPSMFLDPKGRRTLIRIIQNWVGTKLIASHDIALIRETCSRVLVLQEGKIIADGPTGVILEDLAIRQLLEGF